jgi:hypothetical protein
MAFYSVCFGSFVLCFCFDWYPFHTVSCLVFDLVHVYMFALALDT